MVSKFKWILISFLTLFLISNSFSVAEVFSRYDTNVIFNSDDTINVKKSLALKNIHTTGFVPGPIEFKILKNDNIQLLEDSLKITKADGSNIKYQLVKTSDHYSILFNIYMPILPGFEYPFNIEYTLLQDPKGFMFKNIQVPLKEVVEIPILSGSYKITLPDDKYFTYVSYSDNLSSINGNVGMWDIKSDKVPNLLEFEYSKLPLNIFNFKGSLLFWISINLILFIILLFEVRKEVKRFKK